MAEAREPAKARGPASASACAMAKARGPRMARLALFGKRCSFILSHLLFPGLYSARIWYIDTKLFILSRSY